MTLISKDAKIYVAGHKGLVGSAIMENLREKGFTNLIGRTHVELDLLDSVAVDNFFNEEKPDVVVLAAAHVGGIMANSTYRADFILDNLGIQQNVISSSLRHNVNRLLFLGSTCIYPREAEQPIKEDSLLSSSLEYTNEPYAIAKIAGMKMCEAINLQYGKDYISVMPTNLYGPGDNFHLENSHVLPGMMRKMHLAKLLNENNEIAIREDLRKRPIDGIDSQNCEFEEIKEALAKRGIYSDRIKLWGTGKPFREFLWSKDMADAAVYVLLNVSFYDLAKECLDNNRPVRNCHINIGTGKEIEIYNLAEQIKQVVCYRGMLEWDSSKPDGTLRKLCDVSRLHSLGWKHKIELPDGIRKLYEWYLNN